MKEFTATDIQRRGTALYNEVQAIGSAKIVHKSRPEMVVMTTCQLLKILESKAQRDVFIDISGI